jgi:hypothetical protein
MCVASAPEHRVAAVPSLSFDAGAKPILGEPGEISGKLPKHQSHEITVGLGGVALSGKQVAEATAARLRHALFEHSGLDRAAAAGGLVHHRTHRRLERFR